MQLAGTTEPARGGSGIPRAVGLASTTRAITGRRRPEKVACPVFRDIMSIMEVRRRNKILKFMNSGDAKARKLFPAWLQDTEEAEWHNTPDVRARHPSADFLPGNSVIFNLGGND